MYEKISVIIPVYNTIDYIQKCLSSVCNQTYSNLEIICIDDGSTDGTEKIIDEFAQRDSRVIVIHQKNAGESNARNEGLNVSTGEYIGFIDCDDWIEPDMYETLLYYAEKLNVDMVASGYYKDDDSNSIKAENELDVSRDVFGRTELFEYVYKRDLYRGFTSYIWCKLFKRKLLEQQGNIIYFDENLKLGGDIVFFAKIASRVNKAYYINKAFYHYYQRQNSAVHRFDNLSNWLGSIYAYVNVIEYLKENKIEEQIIPWLKRFLGYRASIVAKHAFEQKDKEILDYSQKIMKEVKDDYCVLNSKHLDRIENYCKILNNKIED